MQLFQIFAPFWELVQGFGLKFGSKDENVVSLQSLLSVDPSAGVM